MFIRIIREAQTSNLIGTAVTEESCLGWKRFLRRNRAKVRHRLNLFWKRVCRSSGLSKKFQIDQDAHHPRYDDDRNLLQK